LVLVPALLLIGLERHYAHATSLAGIVLIAVTGALSLGAADSVRWDVGLTIGLGGVVGSILGASTMHRMSVRGLTIAFGLVLLVAGIRMISGPEPLPGAADFSQFTQVGIALGIGLVAGLLAGLTGIGGGTVNVPSMVFLLGMPQLVAQGSSFVAVVMTALAGSFVNFRNGRFQIRDGLWVGAGGSAGALVSSQIALGIDEKLLTTLFGVLLLIVAGRSLANAFQRPAVSSA
jgi:uncharacterized membrane protein YfcA